MHELSLCQSIVRIVAEKIRDLGQVHLKSITLEIGVLAAVEKTSLLFNFNVLKKNTFLEDCALNIIDVEGRAFCDFCKKDVIIADYRAVCPHCQTCLQNIVQGLELRVKSLELN